jgi:hypothetical protein
MLSGMDQIPLQKIKIAMLEEQIFNMLSNGTA